MAVSEDLKTVRERYRALLWDGECLDAADERADPLYGADELAAALVPGEAPGTFCWPDIDYGDANRNFWRTSRHYVRIERALVLGGREKLNGDREFREKMTGALRYWLTGDFRNPNWWHNEIGMPGHMGHIGLLMRGYLSHRESVLLNGLVSRGSAKLRPDILRRTGANLIWGINITVCHALLTDDDDLLLAAARRTAAEMEYSGEGIQPDHSFYQHGPRWYSGGYGASFTVELGRLCRLFLDTEYAFPKRNLDIFLGHVLDGQRRMMLHGYFDPNGVGRELTRRGVLKRGGLCRAVGLLAAAEGLPRREELAAFDRDNRHAPAEDDSDPFSFTVYYPRVSALCHRKNGTYIGVKCHAPGQYDAEICNSEGELCYNMSYGTRYSLMCRGDEYYDLVPVFDWAHVPGTVARVETDDELLTHRDWWRLPLPNDHTGGAVCGERGIVYERPEHDGISLTASFFVFDGRLFCLGTGLSDTGNGGDGLTVTVDQCPPSDPVVSPDGREASNGGFTYRVLDEGAGMTAGVLRREGSWQRNSFEEDYVPVTGEVFLAYVPLESGASGYAYCAFPRGEEPGARVLSNTPFCQAIRLDDGTVMAVFHTDGELDADGRTFRGRAGKCLITGPDGEVTPPAAPETPEKM